MNVAASAGLLAALFFGPPQNVPPPLQPSTAANAERIETGHIASPGGDVLDYRIRLLPPASFPELPAPVAAQLSQRACMIPQTFEAQQPENVIRGAFRTSGSDDWAALCSAAGVTTLYAFFAGQYTAPMALRSQPDTAWLSAEPGSSVAGSAWGIALRRVTELRSSPQFRRLAHPDHDGIEDARIERSATIHYYEDGKWIVFAAGS